MKSESFSPPPDSLASTLPITSSSHSKIWLVNLKTAVKELEIPVQGIIVLGRGVGSLKECTDKRLSRHHAELSVQNPSRGIALLISVFFLFSKRKIFLILFNILIIFFL